MKLQLPRTNDIWSHLNNKVSYVIKTITDNKIYFNYSNQLNMSRQYDWFKNNFYTFLTKNNYYDLTNNLKLTHRK